jgi:hypothetical protein
VRTLHPKRRRIESHSAAQNARLIARIFEKSRESFMAAPPTLAPSARDLEASRRG